MTLRKEPRLPVASLSLVLFLLSCVLGIFILKAAVTKSITLNTSIKEEELNEAITRLTQENARLRNSIEELQIEIRRRAPAADGLTLKGAITAILNERDKSEDRIQIFREELKKTLTLLLNGQFAEAKQQINIFLFTNAK